MTEANASDYIARALHVLIDPAALVKILADNPHMSEVFFEFLRQDLVLFVCTPAIFIGILFSRSVSPRLKGFIGMLLVCALGIIIVMSKRHFLAQYSIFPQVPLLLVWPLALFALTARWRKEQPASGPHWAVPVAVTAAFVFVLTVYPRVDHKYSNYQSDNSVPVNSLTLTFLYDHDAHTKAYLEVMKTHYGDREQFSKILESYLADPMNRY